MITSEDNLPPLVKIWLRAQNARAIAPACGAAQLDARQAILVSVSATERALETPATVAR